MTDHRARLAAREPMSVEEEAEELLRRQRAGLTRQVDVGRCTEPVEDPRAPCPTCNGTGRRYRSGLELAAFCGHEAARLALVLALSLEHEPARYADNDYARIRWWTDLRLGFGDDMRERAYRAAGVPENPATSPTWLPRLAAQASRIATDQAKAALIRWALTEP